MITIYKKSTNEFISDRQLRLENKNISFPSVLNESSLEGLDDYQVVIQTEKPVLNRFQKAEFTKISPEGEDLEFDWVISDNIPTNEELMDLFESSIDSLLNSKAHEYGYDSVYTMVSYRGDPNPKFAQEAESMFQWRSAVWTKANELLTDYLESSSQNPSTPIPSIEDIINQLPEFTLV